MSVLRPGPNYHRGLLRLWVAVAVSWAIAVGIIYAEEISDAAAVLSNPHGMLGSVQREAEADARGRLFGVGRLIVLPPIALLIAGGLGVWVSQGFRPRPPE